MAKNKVSLSPSDISEKWNRRMKGSIQDIQKGIDGVTDSPAEAAVAKQDKMLQNLTQAINDGKWASGLSKVTLQDWKSKTKQKVQERLAGGVDGAMGKRKDFDQYLVNTLNGILPDIKNSPDMTLEDSVNRVRMLMEHMANNRYKS